MFIARVYFTCCTKSMKTHIVVQSRSNVARWQKPFENTESLLSQVRKLTHELQLLKTELDCDWVEAEGTVRHLSNVAGSTAASDFNSFKAAADEMTRVLASLLQRLPENSKREAVLENRESRQGPRYEQLFVSRIEPHTTSTPSGSFFERLHLVIDGYMQNRGIAPGDKLRKP